MVWLPRCFLKHLGLILIILGRFTADFKVCLDPKLKYLVLLELHGALVNGSIRSEIKIFRLVSFPKTRFGLVIFPGTKFHLVFISGNLIWFG